MKLWDELRADWRSPIVLIFLLSAGMALSMSTFSALLNNFVVERINFSGREIGFLHTRREVIFGAHRPHATPAE